MKRHWANPFTLALGIQATLVLATVMIVRTASAHEFTIETLMNGFVKIEPRESHLVVRVPLHVLKSVKLPVSGREIDLTAADTAIQKALSQLGNEITIWEDNRPLVPSAAIGPPVVAFGSILRALHRRHRPRSTPGGAWYEHLRRPGLP